MMLDALWITLGAIYGLLMLGVWRMAAGHLAWRMNEVEAVQWPTICKPKPTGDQWFGALLGGLVIALLWPLALVFLAWPVKIGAERDAAHKLKLRERDEVIE